MRVAVCLPQVPFVHGGAEILADGLVDALEARGHEAALITIPFRWYPTPRMLTEAMVWRLLELEESHGRPIDLVVATKFPSYAIRHPNKVVWLIHQFRQAYELDGTPLGQFGAEPLDRATRRSVHRLDRLTLGEARRLFAISRNVADRLRTSTGLDAEVLLPPPQPLPYRRGAYGDTVVSVGRLDSAKRVDLLIEAAATAGDLHIVVVGDGPERPRLEQLAGSLGLNGRVRFAGRLGAEELADVYATCLAVYYAPFDEDFGLVPYEAFLAERPVVTTRDAGGPLEAVTDRRTGVVCEPTPAAVAEALSWLASDRERAAALGRAGRELAETLTWDRVVDRLLEGAGV
jgi:glycosyltransferase involved in cell wall biosynthesis